MAKEKLNVLESNLLTEEQRAKLKKGLNMAVVQKTHIKDLNDSLKEQIKELSAELGIEVSDLNNAISRIMKQDFFDVVKKQDNVETILTISGMLAQASDE